MLTLSQRQILNWKNLLLCCRCRSQRKNEGETPVRPTTRHAHDLSVRVCARTLVPAVGVPMNGGWGGCRRRQPRKITKNISLSLSYYSFACTRTLPHMHINTHFLAHAHTHTKCVWLVHARLSRSHIQQRFPLAEKAK